MKNTEKLQNGVEVVYAFGEVADATTHGGLISMRFKEPTKSASFFAYGSAVDIGVTVRAEIAASFYERKLLLNHSNLSLELRKTPKVLHGWTCKPST